MLQTVQLWFALVYDYIRKTTVHTKKILLGTQQMHKTQDKCQDTRQDRFHVQQQRQQGQGRGI